MARADPVCFTGSVVKTRIPKRPKWWDPFFLHFGITKDAATAAKEVGVSIDEVSEARKTSEEFAARYKEVWRALVYHLEASAMARAIHGWDEPVFYQGEQCGTKRVYNPALTIFMLKASLPERYHLERHEIDQTAQEQGRLLREFFEATMPKHRTVVPERN